MSVSEGEGIEIRASHPDGDLRWRVWVAVDGTGDAVSVVVVLVPAPGASAQAVERILYTVERARRRGIGTRLVRHAHEMLAAEDPPIMLQASGLATSAGYRVMRALGGRPEPGRAASLASKGLDYESFDQTKADWDGVEALRGAAARLGLPAPQL